jgi:hypothetical protein
MGSDSSSVGWFEKQAELAKQSIEDRPQWMKDAMTPTLEDLVRELFYYLDKREETDGGREFSPNYISSCRALDGAAMGKLLKQIKALL